MRKLLLIVSLFMLLSSCSPEEPTKYGGGAEFTGGMRGHVEYAITEKVIDSCEYIIIFGNDGRNIIHKANCENTFHIKN